MPQTRKTQHGSSLRQTAGQAARLAREEQAQRQHAGSQRSRQRTAKATSAKAAGKPAKRAATTGQKKQAKKAASAARRQGKARVAASTASVPARVGLTFLRVVAVVLVFAVVCAAILYPVAKPYYTAFRDGQRSEAQIAAVQERNEALEEENESLKTDEGIEAQARNDYGYVMEGEESAVVTNVEGSSSITDVPDQVDVDEICAPQTWYYDILDRVFFYDNEATGS